MPIDLKGVLGLYRQLASSASLRVSPLCLGTMTLGGIHPGEFLPRRLGWGLERRMDRFRQELWRACAAINYISDYMMHCKDEIQANFVGTGARSMYHSLDESLGKLQTSYIDLFYAHYRSILLELLGLRNLDTGIDAEPQQACSIRENALPRYLGCPRQHGLRQCSVYQARWNAARRDHERDTITMRADERMGRVPYATLNAGNF